MKGLLTQFDDDIWLYELDVSVVSSVVKETLDVEFNIQLEDQGFVASFPTGSHWRSKPVKTIEAAVKACDRYAKDHKIVTKPVFRLIFSLGGVVWIRRY